MAFAPPCAPWVTHENRVAGGGQDNRLAMRGLSSEVPDESVALVGGTHHPSAAGQLTRLRLVSGDGPAESEGRGDTRGVR